MKRFMVPMSVFRQYSTARSTVYVSAETSTEARQKAREYFAESFLVIDDPVPRPDLDVNRKPTVIHHRDVE